MSFSPSNTGLVHALGYALRVDDDAEIRAFLRWLPHSNEGIQTHYALSQIQKAYWHYKGSGDETLSAFFLILQKDLLGALERFRAATH